MSDAPRQNLAAIEDGKSVGRPIDTVRSALEKMKPQLMMALPKHLTADRLLRVTMTALQTNPKLLDCDRTSLYRAIFTCAQLGLEPDGVLGQAYLIPFAGKAMFIPGYKGLLSLARNSGDVTSIAAHEIREKDIFEFDFASGVPPKHTFNIRQSRGDVIAFYAVARFKDGSFHWDMMTREEVERIRDGSQGYQAAVSRAKKYGKDIDSPWAGHYVEMGKKTVVRRIAKYLPMSVQKAAAIADSYDTGRHVNIDTHGELVIEGEAVAHEDDAPQLENRTSQLDRFEEQHGAEEDASAKEDAFGLAPLAQAPAQDAPERSPAEPPTTGKEVTNDLGGSRTTSAPAGERGNSQPHPAATDLLGDAPAEDLTVPLPRNASAREFEFFARQMIALVQEKPGDTQRIARSTIANEGSMLALKASAPDLYDQVQAAIGAARRGK